MSCYIHHVPGRLRIKSPHMKGNHSNAQTALALAQAVDGVTSAEVNALTGSIVIRFDVATVKPISIIGALERGGVIVQSAARPMSDEAAGVVNQFGQVLGKALVGALIERVIERSAIRFIAALI